MIGLSKSKRNRIIAEAVQRQIPSAFAPSAHLFLKLLPALKDELDEVIEEIEEQGDDHKIFKILRGE